MLAEHVPATTEIDRILLAAQTALALALVLAAYALAKLGRGWFPPHRPRP
jgi:hypothetical protein